MICFQEGNVVAVAALIFTACFLLLMKWGIDWLPAEQYLKDLRKSAHFPRNYVYRNFEHKRRIAMKKVNVVGEIQNLVTDRMEGFMASTKELDRLLCQGKISPHLAKREVDTLYVLIAETQVALILMQKKFGHIEAEVEETGN